MPTPSHDTGTFDAATLLQELADGVGVVDATGEILWMSGRLAAQEPETLRKFADAARECLRDAARPRRVQLKRFRASGRSFEVVVSPLGVAETTDRALATLMNVSPRQRLLDRVEAVDISIPPSKRMPLLTALESLRLGTEELTHTTQTSRRPSERKARSAR